MGHLRAEALLDVVEVGRRVLDCVVEHGREQHLRVVHAKKVPRDQTDAENMTHIRCPAVLPPLPVMGPGSERDRVKHGRGEVGHRHSRMKTSLPNSTGLMSVATMTGMYSSLSLILRNCTWPMTLAPFAGFNPS